MNHQIPQCPGCKRPLPRDPFNPPRFEAPWGCRGCAKALCAGCYVSHTAKEHPNLNVSREE